MAARLRFLFLVWAALPLGVVALHQWYVHRHDASAWAMGGFGMYANADHQDHRVFKSWLVSATSGVIAVTVAPTPVTLRTYRAALSIPTAGRLKEWRSASGLNDLVLLVQLHGLALGPDFLRVTLRPIGGVHRLPAGGSDD